MTAEDFTAIAMCPHCGTITTHPFRLPEPQLDPSSPVARVQRRIEATMELFNIRQGYPPKVMTTDPDAVVIRECHCGAEWAQR